MIPLATLRELFDYNYWARDRQLEACAALTPEQFLRPLGSSFSSLRDTLAHLVGAEWIWLERWRGRSPAKTEAAEYAGEKFATLAAIEERWRAVERGVREYLDRLDEATLSRPLTYQNLQGEPWTYPLWRTLLHVVNHQTYHRGQVTTLLRQLGAKAAPIDFLHPVFHDTRKARPSGGAMIPLSVLHELYGYNYWARDRQLEACAGLTDEQFRRPLGSSFSSLRDTLVHLVEAECVWPDVWQGRSPLTRHSADDFPTLSAVRAHWTEVERHLRAYLQSLDEPALARPLTGTSRSRGDTWTYPLWRTLLHVVNHQTYHRGQVTTLLRQLGAQPPQIDYLDAHDVHALK